MPNLTLAIPEELYRRMKRHSELKWSDVARKAIEKKLNEVESVEKALANSTLTEQDAGRIGHSINAGLRKRSSVK